MESSLARGSPPSSVQPLPRGLGRYELVEALGGGMSEVYRARIADGFGPERPLVVKLAAQSVSDDPKASVRFLDEAKLALALSHGNITSAFEFGKADGRYFIVMEYVRGASVRQLVESARRLRATIPAGCALTVGIEVARALQYAHTFVHPELGPMPLVHRDVNPSNVLVARDGQVKLTDFGIAHALGRDPAHGVIWGQAHYVAPELFDGSAASAAADLFALGAVLFQLLTLEAPTRGRSEAEILEAVRTGPAPSVRALRSELPQEVDAFIASLLSRDPANRPATAEDTRRQLESLRDVVAPGFRIQELADTARALLGPEPASPSISGQHLAVSDATVPLAASPPRPAAPEAVPPRAALPMPTMPRTGPARAPVGGILFVLLLGAIAIGAWRWSRPASPRSTRRPTHTTALAPARPRASPPRPSPTVDVVSVSPITPVVAHTAPSGPRAAHARKVAPLPPPPLPPTPPPVAAATPAVITINSWPWSVVTVDGHRLAGHTPLRNIELAPGSHTVHFDNPELRMQRSVTVSLSAGERRVVSAMLEPADGSSGAAPQD